MERIKAYEKALTLYEKIFSGLRNREERYFLGTIKHDFVFFLFALIFNSSYQGKKKNSVFIGKRFFPRNFQEWRFGARHIILDETEINTNWSADKDYFRADEVIKRTGEKMAVLTYGLDFERAFNLEVLKKEGEIGAVIDWRRKIHWTFRPSFFYFFWQNFLALGRIYGLLKRSSKVYCSLFDFLRYFLYYAFLSAQIRSLIKTLSKDESLGAVIFSDLDNAWGNSFLLWSYFYGFRQIVYPHGSPFIFNKNRYFEPEEFYLWTTNQENCLKECSSKTKINLLRPKRTAEIFSQEELKKDKIKKIIIATAMEWNLEIPFGDRETLLSYIEEIAGFACKNGISVTIKSHKLLDWHEDYNIISKKYPCLTHVRERWKTDKLKEMDLAILMNSSSTMVSQLLSLGIPAITCREVLPEILTKHFSIPEFQFVAKSKEELRELLGRFLSDKEFYIKARKQAQSIFASIIKM